MRLSQRRLSQKKVLISVRTVCFLSILGSVAVSAQVFTNLVSFNGSNGFGPHYVSLVQGRDGNLWGTTEGGGSLSLGTAFKVTPLGRLTMVHDFRNYSQGSTPKSGLLAGADGNFYGAAPFGGSNAEGTVYRLTPGGVYTDLHNFFGTDGTLPTWPLVRGTDGNLYGTTMEGGANGVYGTVFRITTSGILTTLFNFDDIYRYYPNGLTLGTDGSFYGTTSNGGSSSLGVVFRINPAGAFTELHSFTTSEGYPLSDLIQAKDGKFYGETFAGGAQGFGTVFSVTSTGTLTVLHSFDGTHGESPATGLTQGTDGNLYGTALLGGAHGKGVIFRITTSGAFTVLHDFAGVDGAEPYGGLTQHTNGKFYGTTHDGGTFSEGNVFSLDMGLAPFVEALPGFGKVESQIGILGANLASATSVTFNGMPATFKVGSSTYITANVPSGATTGPIQVTTSTTTLPGNVDFHVLP